MVENRTLFFISGFISLSLFFTVILLFINMMFSKKSIESYALKKDNFISISLEMPVIKNKVTKKIAAKQQIIESVDVSEEDAKVDIDDLFSDVWTQKIKRAKSKPKKMNNKRIQEIQKKIKTTKEYTKESITKKLNTKENSNLKENSEESSSTANEVNEYFAKIQALVYKYFHPPENSQGYSVKAVIHLSAIGKVLDFRILGYSTNNALNKECDLIKKRLMSVMFPINPKNVSGNYIIILKSEE